MRQKVAGRMRSVIDPELGVNIVDLGLLYQMVIRDETFVLNYTITTPGCPMRRYLQRKIEETLDSIEGLGAYEVNMVFEPEWGLEMIKEGVEFFSVPPPMVTDVG